MFLLNFETSDQTQVTREDILSLLQSHREKLNQVTSNFLLRVTQKEGEDFLFLITPSEIMPTEINAERSDFPEITVDYQTLRKVLENPQRALRFYFQGKIKIKGDPRDLFIL